MENREIPKNPKTPKLSDKSIEWLTKLCFREDNKLEKADLIFVIPSTVYIQECTNFITKLLAQNISNNVIVPGGNPTYHDSKSLEKPESALILDKIDQAQFPGVRFFSENKSGNTLENVIEGLKLFNGNNIVRLLFISKAHAAGRTYLTFRKYVPEAEILQKTFISKHFETGLGISREQWHTFDFGRERIWGEFLRIKKYGMRGDIEFEEVKDIVRAIETELSL